MGGLGRNCYICIFVGLVWGFAGFELGLIWLGMGFAGLDLGGIGLEIGFIGLNIKLG